MLIAAGFRVLNTRHIDEGDAVPAWLGRRSARLAAARYAAHNQAKRRPMFVGKRLEPTNDGDETIDYNERSGPMFVGKRRNPFFVG